MNRKQVEEFAIATGERAVKTFAQSLAALLVADGTDILNSDWKTSLSVSGMAALLSVLTSIGSGQINGPGPSVTDAEVLPLKRDTGWLVDPKNEAGYTNLIGLVVGVLLVLILVVVLLRVLG